MKKKTQNNFKFHIKSGDTVKVLSGNSRGTVGKVLKVDRKKYRAIVEGANMITKHTKARSEETEGGRIEKEGTIHISNLMLVDPATNETTRTGRKKGENGRMVRYSKKTGAIINGNIEENGKEE